MRYYEILQTRLIEGRDAPLYHGSSVAGALSILKGDEIWAGTQHQKSALSGLGRKGDAPVFGVSLSRNMRTAFYFGAAVFEIDQRRLAQNYKIIPFDYWSAGNPKDISKRGKGPGNQYEYEEFCVGSIKPLRRYLRAIHMTSRSLAWIEESFPSSTCGLLLHHPLLKVDGKALVPADINA